MSLGRFLRRALGAAAVVALTIVSTAAAEKPGRVQTLEYLHPNGIDTSHGMVSDDLVPLTFTPRHGDRSVHFDLADATRGNVIIYVYQEDEDGERVKVRDALCGTHQDVPLVSDQPVEVYLYAGLCVNHNFSYTSSGSITATFSTKPVDAPQLEGHHH